MSLEKEKINKQTIKQKVNFRLGILPQQQGSHFQGVMVTKFCMLP